MLQQFNFQDPTVKCKAYPNGYGSISVAIYLTQAWLGIYNIDLNLIFKD